MFSSKLQSRGNTTGVIFMRFSLGTVMQFSVLFPVDGENFENDTETIVWTENILSVFEPKFRFQSYPD